MTAVPVNVRYMVEDVETAIAWYTTYLGFTLHSKAAPAFADVTRGPSAAIAKREKQLRRTGHAGWSSTGSGRLESHPTGSAGSGTRAAVEVEGAQSGTSRSTGFVE
jgi:hypothetical protein